MSSDREIKWIDYEKQTIMSATWAGSNLDDSSAKSLCSPAQGINEDQRFANRYDIHSLELRGWVRTDPEFEKIVVQGDRVVRIVVFLDKQTNKAQAAGEKVMAAINPARDAAALYNNFFHQRFTIVCDITIKLDVAEAGLVIPQPDPDPALFGHGAVFETFYKHYKFSPPIRVHCVDTGAGETIADTVDNSLHIIGVTSGGDAHITYASRVEFSDE